MRKLILLASAAAMAATMPALAQGGGNGKGKGGGPAQAETRGGGGNGQARGGGKGRAERAQPDRPQRAASGGQGRGNGQAARRDGAERGNGQARQAERAAARSIEREQRQALRGPARGRQPDMRQAQRSEDRNWSGRLSRSAGGGDRHYRDRLAYWREGRPLPVTVARGFCPPGLAKQNAFCLPPGQLGKGRMIGQRIGADRFAAVPEAWQYRFRDGDDHYYRYDGGYIYRIDRGNDFISSIIPLMSGRLAIGEPLPLGYEVYNLPVAYRDRYADDAEWLYRYDDNAIYRVDNDSGLIDSLVALLTGSAPSVGSRLPAGYDVYNLPFDYRDRYADSDQSLYRYADGGIYEVDPQTMLVRALIEMVL